MRRDRAAHVRSIAWLLSLGLAASGLLAAPAATAAPGGTTAPVPTAVVTPPGVEQAPAPERRIREVRRSVRAAELAGTAHITGLVTSADHEPLEGVVVVAYRWSDGDEEWEGIQYDETAADGSYDLARLAADSYRVGYFPDGLGYEPEYWDDAADLDDATDVALAAAQSMAGIDAELTEQGRVTGKVIGPEGQPLAGIDVTAYAREADDEDYWYDSSEALTGPDGTYDLGHLPSGTYKVLFFDQYTGYVGEYWNDSQTWDGATTIDVTSGVVVDGIDAELAVGAATAGDITGPAGQPLGDIEVDVYLWDDDTESWDWAYYTFTDDDGRYVLSGLPTGDYRFGFVDWSESYATEFWDDASRLQDATTISLAAGETLGDHDAQLSELASISGIVTDADGGRLADIVVELFRWSEDEEYWTDYYTTYTETNGSYVMGGIEPGRYRMRFSSYGDYLPEYWDDAPTLAAATDIQVGAGQQVGHVDADLATATTPAVTSVTAPAIAGDPRVGATLTASPGTWAPNSGLRYDYQWVVGGHVVADATAPTYTPVTADIGKTVQVRVRVTRLGYTAGTALSAATGAVSAVVTSLSNVLAPTIGSPKVGVATHAMPGTWSPAYESVGYQWLVGGVAVAGATAASYTPVPADAGKRLQVRVTATAAGHSVGVAASAPRTVTQGDLRATTKPKITGRAKKNATLSVSPGAWSPKVTVKVQWYAGGKAIPKATATKLKLAGKTVRTVAGKAISVLVTVAAPGYDTVSTRLTVPGRLRR